jgi:hypothetical protein
MVTDEVIVIESAMISGAYAESAPPPLAFAAFLW